MTQDQKIQLRITSLKESELINEQRIRATQKTAETTTIINEAQLVFDHLTKDALPESSLIGVKPLVN